MNKWTREETIVAFNLYCKIPFKNSSKTHPLITKYAKILGRTPSALNMKIGNIGRLDPDLKEQGIIGLTHGAKLEEEVWSEFYDNPELLAFESERIIAQLSNQNIEISTDIKIEDLPKGTERNVLIKQRVNQSFFRAVVMSSYNSHCCISGINVPELVEACHIVDWAQDYKNRTNPKNGLCMNSFFHKAYDKNLLGITPDMKIVISEKLQYSATENSFSNYLRELNGRKIILPDKFFPQPDLLEIHYDKFLKQ
ncbi:MAG: HNH endonuclease [Muribaculaceae bacterium]|nr:HNH endonuclease [Muribaculaceae bacterium]